MIESGDDDFGIIFMWVFPKIGVGPPNHPFFIGVPLVSPPILGVFPLFLG